MDVRIGLDAIGPNILEEEYPGASTHIIFCLNDFGNQRLHFLQ